mmetsp:Transcript_8077/g.29828  ORF Transcript_8077/g.29828 Transcript_8077/m.29828 type:complete len:833 (+) Transcript_8077:132-2630(+)
MLGAVHQAPAPAPAPAREVERGCTMSGRPCGVAPRSLYGSLPSRRALSIAPLRRRRAYARRIVGGASACRTGLVTLRRTVRCSAWGVKQEASVATFVCPLTYHEVLGLPDDATPLDIRKAHRILSGVVSEEGYTVETLECKQALIDHATSVLLSRFNLTPSELAFQKNSPSEIPLEWLPGLLCLLEESGQPGTVLQLGAEFADAPATRAYRRDILMAMSLAKCTYARKALEAGRLPMGCEALAEANELLALAGDPPLAPTLAAEIDVTLETMAPAVVLEHLGDEIIPENKNRRSGALLAVRELLLSPKKTDGSQSTFDPNPKYVDTVFARLTAQETLEIVPFRDLYDAASGVQGATLPWLQPRLLTHIATAYMAQGYQERRPVYIACADILLRKIEGVGVPVPVERAACAVLLGQVEAAIALLEEGLHGVPEQEGSNGLPVKQEPEAALALDFIRMEAEQADGDYLPGLCAYVERYMGTKVAPKFRMADRKPLEPVSLVDYFGSARVTAYASTVSYPPSLSAAKPQLLVGALSSLAFVRRGFDLVGGIATALPRLVGRRKKKELPPVDSNGYKESIDAREVPPDTQLVEEQDLAYPSEGPQRTVYPESRLPLPIRQAIGVCFLIAAAVIAKVGIIDRMASEGGLGASLKASMTPGARKPSSGSLPGGSGGNADVACEMETCNPNVSPKTTLLNQRSSLIETGKVHSLVKKWQARKAAALGKDHDVSLLDYSLAEPMLSDWKDRALEAEDKGWYWRYNLRGFAVDNVKDILTAEGHPTGKIRVEVTLDEEATVVDQFRDRTGESYSSKYRARYELKQVHGRWLITRGTVIPGR